MTNTHHNADSLRKKTEFYERLEQKQANQAEIKEGFTFLDKATYKALPLTRWLVKSGYPVPGHPELPLEKAAEIKIVSKREPVSLVILLRELATGIGNKCPTGIGNKGSRTVSQARFRKRENSRAAQRL